MAIGFAGLVCLAFLPAAPVAFDIVWRLSICGLGFGMFFSPNSRQVLGAAPAARAAAAGAMFSTIRGTGQTLGATAVAALLAQRLGNGPTPMLISSALALRSEERRVGEECVSQCRSRRSPDHEKKNKNMTRKYKQRASAVHRVQERQE